MTRPIYDTSSDMEWFYPYQIQTMQALGRSLRPQSWHDHHNDPCDEWPVFYWMGQPMPLLTSDDRLMAGVLRHNVNAQYGKFGKTLVSCGVDIETKPGETVVFIDDLSGRFGEVIGHFVKSRDDEMRDLGRRLLLDDIPPKEACQEPPKRYDYQQHNKQRKRRP